LRFRASLGDFDIRHRTSQNARVPEPGQVLHSTGRLMAGPAYAGICIRRPPGGPLFRAGRSPDRCSRASYRDLLAARGRLSALRATTLRQGVTSVRTDDMSAIATTWVLLISAARAALPTSDTAHRTS